MTAYSGCGGPSLSEPAVDDVAHIGIMTFSDSARVVMPLSQMSEHDRADAVRGGRHELRCRVPRAWRRPSRRTPPSLKAQGYRVYRPCAFFLTDGEPLDLDWEQTFRTTLTYDPVTGVGMKGHPVFVPFGFRDAPEHVLA